jgi:thiamine-monophosphate kinase
MQIQEDVLIARICRAIPSLSGTGRGDVRLGIGDDAAVVRPRCSRDWVISTDSFVEGAHFLGARHPAHSVGYKSLARATSDLAAMGAEARYFFLTLALPAARTGAWLDGFCRGMAQAARQFKMRLLGGDLARQQTVTISLTVIGEARPGEVVTRAGARPGDVIYVSGMLGDAQAGLEMLLRGKGSRSARALSPALRKHLYPQPRLKLGRWLARRGLATAMMDLSDGLSTDLTRLCRASKVGARIAAEAIPYAPPPARSGGKPAALNRALHGGEDYELLFTVPPPLAGKMPARFAGVSLTRIGEITAHHGVILLDVSGRAMPLLPLGWDHFARR